MQTLSPTPRTTPTRGRHRQVDDRARLLDFLDEALIAQLGVVAERDGVAYPVVLPTAYAVDRDGPDAGGTLYLHGSVAAGWLAPALARDVCVSVTEVDGLVLARSGMHHSANYRSAVVLGRPRRVDDPDERGRALDLIIDHLVPGRAATLRRPTRKELAATVVLALPLAEASMKVRAGDPVDDEDDVLAGAWAGVVPVRRVLDEPLSAADSHDEVPADVRRVVGAVASR